MAYFRSQEELRSYLQSVHKDYGDLYAESLWRNAVTSRDILAFNSSEDLQHAGVTEKLHANHIRFMAARAAGTQKAHLDFHRPAWKRRLIPLLALMTYLLGLGVALAKLSEVEKWNGVFSTFAQAVGYGASLETFLQSGYRAWHFHKHAVPYIETLGWKFADWLLELRHMGPA